MKSPKLQPLEIPNNFLEPQAVTPHDTAIIIWKIYGNAEIWNQVFKSYANAQSDKNSARLLGGEK